MLQTVFLSGERFGDSTELCQALSLMVMVFDGTDLRTYHELESSHHLSSLYIPEAEHEVEIFCLILYHLVPIHMFFHRCTSFY